MSSAHQFSSVACLYTLLTTPSPIPIPHNRTTLTVSSRTTIHPRPTLRPDLRVLPHLSKPSPTLTTITLTT